MLRKMRGTLHKSEKHWTGTSEVIRGRGEGLGSNNRKIMES